MKVCIIQPPYSTKLSDADFCFAEQMRFLDSCDDSMDIIVLPEAADIPSLAKTKEDSERTAEKYNEIENGKNRSEFQSRYFPRIPPATISLYLYPLHILAFFCL